MSGESKEDRELEQQAADWTHNNGLLEVEGFGANGGAELRAFKVT